MLFYWTLKTGYDSVQYALGNTNVIKGTGVWKNMVDVKRDGFDTDATQQQGLARRSTEQLARRTTEQRIAEENKEKN